MARTKRMNDAINWIDLFGYMNTSLSFVVTCFTEKPTRDCHIHFSLRRVLQQQQCILLPPIGERANALGTFQKLLWRHISYQLVDKFRSILYTSSERKKRVKEKDVHIWNWDEINRRDIRYSVVAIYQCVCV